MHRHRLAGPVRLLVRFLALCLWALGAGWVAAAPPAPVAVLSLEGPIGPATADYVERGLRQAREAGAQAVVLRLDTPGGLDASMRDIVQAILAAPLPVVAYVAPPGARAASAGTYILYAAHVAAMAPGTNLGAATPVALGGGRREEGPSAAERKAVNDAVAYIRSLARLRGRNADWAERAVREAASLEAAEALRAGVVELLAGDLGELLQALDGRRVSAGAGETVLRTAGAPVLELPPDWRTRLLAVLTDPNVAYVLMLIGLYGLIYEFANPGLVAPGVVGAISLLLALFAFQVLPVNYAGVALILLGVALMVAEAVVPSFGALGLGGVVAFVIGSVILMDTEAPGFGLSLPLIGTMTLLSAAFLVLVAGMALKARRRPVVSGREALEGAEGEAVEAFRPGPHGWEGRVRVQGELWEARCPQPLRRGDRVAVRGREGLVLRVARAPEEGPWTGQEGGED